MNYDRHEKKDSKAVSNAAKKDIAVPNYRCSPCRYFSTLYRKWSKAYCQDCSRFAKQFIWYVLLDLIIDVKRLKKDFLKVHQEGTHAFEQILSLRDRLNHQLSPGSTEKPTAQFPSSQIPNWEI